jgi:peroxiredoxin Q/BCP|tara:strand:- start:831 stop:1085 length:255 start_codon:yes stop_codon:yes gene_type:complete
VSKDSPKAQQTFKEKNNFPFFLASDPSTEMIQAYKAWGKKKLYGREYMGISRMSYLIDEKGMVEKVYEKVNVKSHAQDVLHDLC